MLHTLTCTLQLSCFCIVQVLDLVGEDAEGIAASKGSYHWDKRHRKYVQLQPGEAVRAGKRVQAGAATPVSLRNVHL
jgi:DBP10CT (NUC160) domain